MMYCTKCHKYLETADVKQGCDEEHREAILFSMELQMIDWAKVQNVFYGLPEQGLSEVVAVNPANRQIELNKCLGAITLSSQSALWISFPTSECQWQTEEIGWVVRSDADKDKFGINRIRRDNLE